MSLGIGLVGLPNVGKSTLFNSLTNAGALVANYPFATIDPNVGIVEVADERLDTLAKLFESDKIVRATLNITDIAGLVAGASHGEGLGNQFLSHIRSCNATVQVVRTFEDSSVSHVDNEHDPKKDIDTINTELVLADLQTVDKRLVRVEKESKADPKLRPMVEQYHLARDLLDSGKPLWSEQTKFEYLGDLQLLTLKPVVYVFNMDEHNLASEDLKKHLSEIVRPTPALFLCAKIESELSALDERDRQELLASYGQDQSGLSQLTKVLHDLLGLQSFLTAGKKEVRAWTIKQGSSAPEAAGAIHSDFERGFIAAEVVSYDDLVEAGSWQAARSSGKVRTEGKSYIIRKDDIIDFKFNVTK